MKSRAYGKALAIMRRNGSAEKAYSLLLDAMSEGDYRAHYALGTWYLYGRYVRKDYRKAFRLLKEAANQDIADAAFDLAVCYEKGEGVKRDPSKAVAMYFRAMRCGDASAAEELRRMFYWGIGVEKNRLLAAEFPKLRMKRDRSIDLIP